MHSQDSGKHMENIATIANGFSLQFLLQTFPCFMFEEVLGTSWKSIHTCLLLNIILSQYKNNKSKILIRIDPTVF